MPHNGYHGKVVGLGSKPSSRQPGIGQSNTSKPKPKKQNVKSLMTSDTAYKVDTPKKKSTTVVKFDDNTGREKGLQSNISSKELGEKRLQEALRIKQENYSVDRRLKDGKYGGNLQKSLDAAQKRFNKLNLTDPSPVKTEKKSYSRALMKKMGIPIDYRNYVYDLFIGGKIGSTKRRDSYKPLSISDFNENQKKELKYGLLSAITKEHGFLKLNSPVNFVAYGENLYHSLGDVSGYINSAGEVIVNDFTDFFGGYGVPTVNESTGKIEDTFTSDDTSYLKLANETLKGASQILDGIYDYSNSKVNTAIEAKTVPIEKKLNNLYEYLTLEFAKSLTNLEGTQEEDYPSKVSELKQVTPSGVVELNLGKVNLGGTN